MPARQTLKDIYFSLMSPKYYLYLEWWELAIQRYIVEELISIKIGQKSLELEKLMLAGSEII